MRQEIKDRIEQIRNGEVPEGYRIEDKYVLPQNWAVMSLGEITLSSDYGTSDSTNDTVGIPVLRMGNMIDGKLHIDDLAYLKLDEDELEKYKLHKGDLLVNRTNSYDLVGKVALFELDGDYVCASYLVRFLLDRKIVIPSLVNYFMNLPDSQRRMKALATKAVQQANLNPSVLKKYFNLPISNLIDEQQKIATIISTWDKAIELKEQLIEQKKEQKRGLMNKLLSGLLRLPGLDGDWRFLKAGDIFENVTDKSHQGIGTVLSSTQDRGIIPRDEIDIDIKFDKNNLSNYKKVKIGDFVISLRSFQGGIEYSNFEGLLSPAYTILRNKIPIASSFYKHLFKSADFITRLNGLIYGIRDGKQIGYKDFCVMKLPYPNSEEQRQIGEILDLAAHEITLLHQEIEVLKLQKKGLMQLLLTGIVRVQN